MRVPPRHWRTCVQMSTGRHVDVLKTCFVFFPDRVWERASYIPKRTSSDRPIARLLLRPARSSQGRHRHHASDTSRGYRRAMALHMLRIMRLFYRGLKICELGWSANAIYRGADRLLRYPIRDPFLGRAEKSVIISEMGKQVLEEETGLTLKDLEAHAEEVYEDDDLFSPAPARTTSMR